MVKIQFYPLDITRRQTETRVVIELYGRMPDGRGICVIDATYDPYLYLIPGPLGLAETYRKMAEQIPAELSQKISRMEQASAKILGKMTELYRISVRYQGDLQLIKEFIEDKGLGECFEFDIPAERKYLIDRMIYPLVLTEAEGEFVNRRSRVAVLGARSVNQESTEMIPKLSIMSLSVYPKASENSPIAAIGICTDQVSRLISLHGPGSAHVDLASDEAELIRKAVELISEMKPDIIVGFDSDLNDLPLLQKRADLQGMRLELGQDYSHLIVERAVAQRARITGICHIDLKVALEKGWAADIQKSNWDIESAAEAIIGRDSSEKGEGMNEQCLRNSGLILQIGERLIPNICEMSRLLGQPLYDVSRMGPTKLTEWYLARRSRDFLEIIPNRPVTKEAVLRRAERIESELILKERPGLYEDILELDPRGIYPSIISIHNISPDTMNCTCCPGMSFPPGEHTWFCTARRGFVSNVVEELISRRIRVEGIIKSGDDSPVLLARLKAISVISYAIYPYMGTLGARWYSVECVRSITAYARQSLTNLAERAAAEGLMLVYGDNDEIYLALMGKGIADARMFVQAFNLEHPDMAEVRPGPVYKRGIFIRPKGGGSRMRYSLIRGDDSIVSRGFESLRRNYSYIAREVHENLLRIILSGKGREAALEYVREVVTKIRKRQIPVQEMVIDSQVQKRIEEYETLSPAVVIARRLKEKGADVLPGSTIRYVVCGIGDLVRDRAKLPEECSSEDYDIEYYVHNQVIPAVEGIMEVLGVSRESLLSGPDQERLDRFF